MSNSTTTPEEIEHGLRNLYARHCSGNPLGQSPAVIYLGIVEHEALKRLANQRISFLITHPDKKCRMEWNGMQVYRVDADSHVGFGATKASLIDPDYSEAAAHFLRAWRVMEDVYASRE